MHTSRHQLSQPPCAQIFKWTATADCVSIFGLCRKHKCWNRDKQGKKKKNTRNLLHKVQVCTKTANCETPNDTSTNFLYNSIRQKQHCGARLWFISSVQTKQLDKLEPIALWMYERKNIFKRFCFFCSMFLPINLACSTWTFIQRGLLTCRTAVNETARKQHV